MRNLKKVLALVLSLVMALSLVTVAGAATFEETFTDASSVSDDYVQAVNVVNGLKVFQGQTDTEFAPKGTFNRAQLAGLAYRIDTGDTAGYGKDSSSRYVQSGTFYDVPDDAWYAGYVGYCYGAGLISGRGNGSYDPMTPVTGTDVLAILLHLVGYKDLFKGANWSIEVAAKAQQLGLLDKVVTANDLTGTASRELVCELSFRTLTQAEMVQKNTATEGYLTLHNLIPGVNTGVANKDDGIDKDITLGEQKFKLVHDDQSYTYDDWGRPSTGWYKADSITYSGSGFAGQSVKKVTIKAKPFVYVPCTITKSYTTADTECEIYEDLGLTATTNTFELWVNGQNATNSYKIDKLDTRTMVGGQNRLTEVYMDYDGAKTNRIVMIDTYLALVTENNEATYDSNSSKPHVRTAANMVLTVFDQAPTKVQTSANYGASTTNYVLDNDPETETWEYAVDTMLLINAKSAKATVKADGEDAAYTTYPVDAGDDLYAEIKGEAAYVDAAQDQWRKNSDYHKVDGAQYDNSLTFSLDDCVDNVKNDFRWWLDGTNLMGVTVLKSTSDYGVITRLWFLDGDGEDGVAYANITYSNGGTEKKVPISEFVMQAKMGDNLAVTKVVDGDKGKALAYNDVATADTTGSLSLTPVHGDASGTNAMALKASTGTDVLTNGLNKGKSVASWAQMTVSTDYSSNADAKGEFGIIYGQLFKFVTNDSGNLVAYEVAGDGQTAATGKNLVFKNLYNAEKPVSAFTKGVSSYTMNTDKVLRMSTTTNILISKDGTSAPKAYVGYKNMPTLTEDDTTEVDWVDVNGDDFADHVFIIGKSATSEQDVLFFYDGGESGLVDKKNNIWEIEGWIDGVPATLQTTTKTGVYNKIIDKGNGMLWAVKVVDGYATDLFYPANGANANQAKTIKNLTAASEELKDLLDTSTPGVPFKATYDPKLVENESKYPAATQIRYIPAANVSLSVTNGTYKINNTYLATPGNGETLIVARDNSTLQHVRSAIAKGKPAFDLFVVSVGGEAKCVYIVPVKATTPATEESIYGTVGDLTKKVDGAEEYLASETDEIKAALKAGKNVTVTGDLITGEFTIPSGQILQVMGNVTGGATIHGDDKTSVLMVEDKYTTSGTTARINFDVKAGDVVLNNATVTVTGRIQAVKRDAAADGAYAAASGKVTFGSGAGNVTFTFGPQSVLNAAAIDLYAVTPTVENYGKATIGTEGTAGSGTFGFGTTGIWNEHGNTLLVYGTITANKLGVIGHVEAEKLVMNTEVEVKNSASLLVLTDTNKITLDNKYKLTNGTLQITKAPVDLAANATLTAGALKVDTGIVTVTATRDIGADVSLTVGKGDLKVADSAVLTVQGSVEIAEGGVTKDSTGQLIISGASASVSAANGVDVAELDVANGKLIVTGGTVTASTDFKGTRDGSIQVSAGVELGGKVHVAVGTDTVGANTTLSLTGSTSATGSSQKPGDVTSSSSSADAKNLGSVELLQAKNALVAALSNASKADNDAWDKAAKDSENLDLVVADLGHVVATPAGNVLKLTNKSGEDTFQGKDSNPLASTLGMPGSKLNLPLLFTAPSGIKPTQVAVSSKAGADAAAALDSPSPTDTLALDSNYTFLIVKGLAASRSSTEYIGFKMEWKDASGTVLATSSFVVDTSALAFTLA